MFFFVSNRRFRVILTITRPGQNSYLVIHNHDVTAINLIFLQFTPFIPIYFYVPGSVNVNL